MITLSGIQQADFNPSKIIQKIGERFEKLDLDKSGTLAKSELSEGRSTKGLDTSKADKIFDWLDVNGDSEISRQEYEERLLAMAKRGTDQTGMFGYSRPGGRTGNDSSGAKEIFGALKTLTGSMIPAERDADHMDQLRELSRKIDAQGFSEDNLSALVFFLTSIVPPIIETA